ILKRDSLFTIVEFQSLRKTIIKHHRCGILRQVALSHHFFPAKGSFGPAVLKKLVFSNGLIIGRRLIQQNR
ncbi:hypothetical protein, partial [Pseudomonas savastanoi]|uniref:hypothetical protein n=1 Tax=Pseudomonas savastanoi TaxID=29438 RepID=UPI001C7F951E